MSQCLLNIKRRKIPHPIFELSKLGRYQIGFYQLMMLYRLITLRHVPIKVRKKQHPNPKHLPAKHITLTTLNTLHTTVTLI